MASWRSITDKDKKPDLTGKIPLKDLPLGKFADMNGSTIYRYDNPNKHGAFDPGCWFIEKHNHKSPYGEVYIEKDGQWGYWVKQIDNPEMKHLANAMCMLKNAAKKRNLSGLCYLEHFIRLKELLRAHGKKEDNL